MNEYIIYTTEGYTEAPNENVEIENCQVLGWGKGDNPSKAVDVLLARNPYIIKSGFDTSKFVIMQVLTRAQRDDISALLNYIIANKEHCIEKDNKTILEIIIRLKTI